VRRFHCAGCAAAFEAARVEEIELRLADGGVVKPGSETLALVPDMVNVEAQPGAMEDRAIEALTRAPQPKRTAPKPKFSMPKLTARKVGGPKLAAPRMPAITLPSISLPRIDPQSRSWKLLSIPIAAALVIAILFALNGGDDQQLPAAPPPAAQTDEGNAATAENPAGPQDSGAAAAAAGATGSRKTKFVHEASFSLALPAGWERIDPPAGATFAAVAADGGADATLWITQDPKLDFPTFVSQSLKQLETLAPDPRILSRVPGPTPESTVVQIGADAPAGQPAYSATLRVAGPYRYYLGTTVQPDASAQTSDDVELINGSLTPELGG
jgi:hypothetical protein